MLCHFFSEPSILFDGCDYNNITYDKGVKFEDGCDALCVCEGQGHVSCVPRCNVLSSGGPACREVTDPDDACCKIMICSFPGNSESEHVDGNVLHLMIIKWSLYLRSTIWFEEKKCLHKFISHENN